MLHLHQHWYKGQEWNIKTCFIIVDSLLLWGSMKGIKFQLSNYLRVPLKASGDQRFLSMAFAALIDHMLNFHFSWLPLRWKSPHIDMCVMEGHHVKPSFVFIQAHWLQGLWQEYNRYQQDAPHFRCPVKAWLFLVLWWYGNSSFLIVQAKLTCGLALWTPSPFLCFHC